MNSQPMARPANTLANRIPPVRRALTPCCADLFRAWAPPEPDPVLNPAPANWADIMARAASLRKQPGQPARLQPIPSASLPHMDGAGRWFIVRKRSGASWGETTPVLAVWWPGDLEEDVQAWNIDRVTLLCTPTARQFSRSEIRDKASDGGPWVLTPVGQPDREEVPSA